MKNIKQTTWNDIPARFDEIRREGISTIAARLLKHTIGDIIASAHGAKEDRLVLAKQAVDGFYGINRRNLNKSWTVCYIVDCNRKGVYYAVRSTIFGKTRGRDVKMRRGAYLLPQFLFLCKEELTNSEVRALRFISHYTKTREDKHLFGGAI
jgi:hypothetical protein